MQLNIHINMHLWKCREICKDRNKRVEILPSVYDNNGIKPGINTRKVTGESPNIWKLNTKRKAFFWKCQGKILKIRIELNENKNVTYYNL